MDDLLPMTMYDFVICSFMVTGGTLIIFFVNPWVIIRYLAQISCMRVRRTAVFCCVLLDAYVFRRAACAAAAFDMTIRCEWTEPTPVSSFFQEFSRAILFFLWSCLYSSPVDSGVMAFLLCPRTAVVALSAAIHSFVVQYDPRRVVLPPPHELLHEDQQRGEGGCDKSTTSQPRSATRVQGC